MDQDVLIWKEDGLPMEEQGPWTEKKYRTLFNYIQMFSTGMKKLWDKRVYVDLYSGAGCVKVTGTDKILKGSPLLALSVTDPFDKYIFCDKDDDKSPWKIEALQKRVGNFSDGKDVEFIQGDCNLEINEIIRKVPKQYGQRVLTFCFVDPFSLDLHFETLKKLAISHRVDFLVLLALMMDANRNEAHYVKEENEKVDLFLGRSDWRDDWNKKKAKDNSFPRFLSQRFEEQVLTLGYKKSSKRNTKEVRSTEKNLPLYHLAFFSRHDRDYDFWNKIQPYADDQGSFDY